MHISVQKSELTFGNVGCHMDNGVAIVNHKILGQCVRLTSDFDIFTYLASGRDPKIRKSIPFSGHTTLSSGHCRTPKTRPNVRSFTRVLKLGTIVVD